jgi:hypothetical protein
MIQTVFEQPVDFAWRQYGVRGKTAVHRALRELRVECDNPYEDPMLYQYPEMGHFFVSACGREAFAHSMEEPAPALAAQLSLPSDMTWRVDLPVTCKKCLRATAQLSAASSPE